MGLSEPQDIEPTAITHRCVFTPSFPAKNVLMKALLYQFSCRHINSSTSGVKARGLFLFVLRKQIRVRMRPRFTLRISIPKDILLENDEMGLGVAK